MAVPLVAQRNFGLVSGRWNEDPLPKFLSLQQNILETYEDYFACYIQLKKVGGVDEHLLEAVSPWSVKASLIVIRYHQKCLYKDDQPHLKNALDRCNANRKLLSEQERAGSRKSQKAWSNVEETIKRLTECYQKFFSFLERKFAEGCPPAVREKVEKSYADAAIQLRWALSRVRRQWVEKIPEADLERLYDFEISLEPMPYVLGIDSVEHPPLVEVEAAAGVYPLGENKMTKDSQKDKGKSNIIPFPTKRIRDDVKKMDQSAKTTKRPTTDRLAFVEKDDRKEIQLLFKELLPFSLQESPPMSDDTTPPDLLDSDRKVPSPPEQKSESESKISEISSLAYEKYKKLTLEDLYNQIKRVSKVEDLFVLFKVSQFLRDVVHQRLPEVTGEMPNGIITFGDGRKKVGDVVYEAYSYQWRDNVGRHSTAIPRQRIIDLLERSSDNEPSIKRRG